MEWLRRSKGQRVVIDSLSSSVGLMLATEKLGLGILDLDLFSRALRLRWLWYEWTDSDRAWVGTMARNPQSTRLIGSCFEQVP